MVFKKDDVYIIDTFSDWRVKKITLKLEDLGYFHIPFRDCFPVKGRVQIGSQVSDVICAPDAHLDSDAEVVGRCRAFLMTSSAASSPPTHSDSYHDTGGKMRSQFSILSDAREGSGSFLSQNMGFCAAHVFVIQCKFRKRYCFGG